MQQFYILGPSGSPQNLQFHIIDSSSVMLSWNPPPVYQQNGIITNYTVTLINYNTGHTFSINTTQLHIQFNSLHAFYNYKCTVAAVTVAIGPQISVVFQTPENGNYYQ